MALASAATFAVGAALPLVVAALAPERRLIAVVSASALAALAASAGARAGFAAPCA